MSEDAKRRAEMSRFEGLLRYYKSAILTSHRTHTFLSSQGRGADWTKLAKAEENEKNISEDLKKLFAASSGPSPR